MFRKTASLRWPPHVMALLRQYAPIHTALEIATLLGDCYTRNAVIGQAYRNGIRIGKPAGTADKAKRKTYAPKPITAPDTSAPKSIWLIDAKEASCRWPADSLQLHKPRCCGANRVEGYPYCAGHCATAYQGIPAHLRRKEPMSKVPEFHQINAKS